MLRPYRAGVVSDHDYWILSVVVQDTQITGELVAMPDAVPDASSTNPRTSSAMASSAAAPQPLPQLSPAETIARLHQDLQAAVDEVATLKGEHNGTKVCLQRRNTSTTPRVSTAATQAFPLPLPQLSPAENALSLGAARDEALESLI